MIVVRISQGFCKAGVPFQRAATVVAAEFRKTLKVLLEQPARMRI
jgi:hypothetical protein